MGIVIKFALLLCSLYFVDICKADSLQIGSNINGQLAYVENVKLSSVPLTTRTKTVFYNGDKIIKSISAIDMEKSKAQVRVTAGGVGSTFANIKLKSERGEPLNFQVQIFV